MKIIKWVFLMFSSSHSTCYSFEFELVSDWKFHSLFVERNKICILIIIILYEFDILRHLETAFMPRNEGTMNLNEILNLENVNI